MLKMILTRTRMALLCLLPAVAAAQEAQTEKRIAELVNRMTLEEKAGQMTQITVEGILKRTKGEITEPYEVDPEKLKEAISRYKVGSILNVGGNAQSLRSWQKRITDIQQVALKERLAIPVLYGIDAIHGNNYCAESVLYPQQISMAASFNNDLVKKIAEATAYETRACFIPWTFSPVLDLGRNPSWPRLWEGYGEDPYLAARLGIATIAGYEGNGPSLNKYQVASCLKHFVGYSAPLSGHDRTPAWIPDRELREYYLPPFKAAIAQGAKTIMINSAEINGIPVHINKKILTDLLKNELQFKGLLVSDWQDIKYLFQRHHVASDHSEAIAMAINAGIDMSMVPDDFSFTTALIALVKKGKIPMARINDAVTRILRVKFYAGLFTNPVGNPDDYPLFAGPEHEQLSYTAATESITLLKNDQDILPLSTGKKILVAGPAASSMRALNGGWSRNWQGDNSDETEKDRNTILEALQERFGNNLQYLEGCGFESTGDLSALAEKAKEADLILLCLGENSYTENFGNIHDLTLPAPQLELASAAARTGKPVILVLAEGRPRVISSIEPLVSAVLLAYLPGNEGGNAIADIITGSINPSGKLPYTYPRHPNSLLPYYHKYTEGADVDPHGFSPQWEFGHGLSYTRFSYSNLQLSSKTLTANGRLRVSVDISNTGQRTGKETVLLYTSDLVASITPEVKRLRGYQKIALQPGERQTVTFEISPEQLSFIDATLRSVTEPGAFRVSIGGLQDEFHYQ
ncbi:MAG: glycoside hydrolase family 3 N-terminal domain-containing protein [Candidatus Pseudobacter hemicellulosilyticus]|uniref:beta-glucosidase n=1 Tax=Candidatus Pseudobacter hemicellulosilyticus TaxID=3121375 RepID=A0AAJ5WRD4_9BACT|nr:MAG: glycoside hydrolase family 3 N-terminal domain-containing protein [Pseudobacter sp.]